MMENPSRRCVVWFGQPSQRERNALAASGWGLRVASASDGGIGLRGGDTVVGLVDLRDPHAVPDNLPGLLEANVHHLPLLALVPDGGEPIACPKLARVERIASSDADPARLVRRLDALARNTDHAGEPKPDNLLGQSPAMCAALGCIHKYAAVDLPVLITGETGTGKEVAARALHRLSRRAERPFIAVNCGALPASLIQAELFGHERGAFTGATARRLGLFESADGGTVFLDEIGDLPAEVQTNLLRVLQEGTLERIGNHQSVKVDVRILAATHVDLEQAIEAGRFRSDLYYRLNVLRLRLPRLAERGDDILPLAQHFLDGFRKRNACRARSFTADAGDAMRAFAWPGNVRELINRVQRAAVVAEHESLSPEDLDLPRAVATATGDEGDRLGAARLQAERDAILSCLRESGFNISECARRLRLSRVTIYRLCKKHDLVLDQLR